MMFFISSSWATKFKSEKKQLLEEDFKKGIHPLLESFIYKMKVKLTYQKNPKTLTRNNYSGGQRNWLQVICNGGVAAYLGVIYFIESGSGEYPIDFRLHYRQSWLSIAILSKFTDL